MTEREIDSLISVGGWDDAERALRTQAAEIAELRRQMEASKRATEVIDSYRRTLEAELAEARRQTAAEYDRADRLAEELAEAKREKAEETSALINEVRKNDALRAELARVKAERDGARMQFCAKPIDAKHVCALAPNHPGKCE